MTLEEINKRLKLKESSDAHLIKRISHYEKNVDTESKEHLWWVNAGQPQNSYHLEYAIKYYQASFLARIEKMRRDHCDA